MMAAELLKKLEDVKTHGPLIFVSANVEWGETMSSDNFWIIVSALEYMANHPGSKYFIVGKSSKLLPKIIDTFGLKGIEVVQVKNGAYVIFNERKPKNVPFLVYMALAGAAVTIIISVITWLLILMG